MKKPETYLLKNLFFIISILFLTSCSWHGKPAPETKKSIEELKKIYSEAVEDAKNADYDEISYNLIPITPFNKKLNWNKNGQVLVVTWTSWEGYDDEVGESMELGREIWVTAVPEVENFCKGLDMDEQALSLRIEQLLGLPPNNGKTKFVEFWVSPGDMFRPSPDPEIDDRESGIDFPVSSLYVNISKEHRNWFNKLKATSYGKDGYPWTRLGYTYDWGNPETEVGASEFLIRKGAKVNIHRILKTTDYCNHK